MPKAVRICLLRCKVYPVKAPGRLVLLGQLLDKAVQEYSSSMRAIRVVVNTAFVVAAAEEIMEA